MRCIVFSFKFAFTILFSAVGVTNLFLTRNCVADLQESFFKVNLSLSLSSRGAWIFRFRILIHSLGIEWHKP